MKILYDEPLRKHTTYNFGGKADEYFIADTIEDLRTALDMAETYPIFIIGGGSNLIATDKGFRGVVIEPAFCSISAKGTRMIVDAGATVNDMISFAMANNLKGIECIAGIPGRLGGLIAMNAGYTKPISTILKSVTVMDYDGNISVMLRDDLQFGFRSSIFQKKKLIVLRAELQLEEGDCRGAVSRYLTRRRLTQPIEYPSCGSVFKKEALKEFQGYGNDRAIVKGSYIVNLGHAKASDVLWIIKHIQAKRHVELEAEIIGEE
jgi:UDP-N-acetylmuramate dehydrogenase